MPNAINTTAIIATAGKNKIIVTPVNKPRLKRYVLGCGAVYSLAILYNSQIIKEFAIKAVLILFHSGIIAVIVICAKNVVYACL
jgi:hypothetical protein